ncbi:antitoxin Xre/MbcA/ParS toxin-binding domain-containing protein [Iamia sp.]|uniref:antitoxin Xre/MbcA/ParS toxin-binding domain-containing protein n=1 Tax=Iamia sp. TaxID=2722710 RepID=UPI002C03BE5D|nr:antitoxin Xre/MbcA/ParS toxin-binding domain-containing protein [Iamia sp.]HXH58186.1 antitoxin Xre/MbcA/ParS toxin-binding domain-containing protein [Iamia sp.]
MDHVLALALQVWTPEVATDWLTTANAHLDGARPIDVLRARGSSEVALALRAEAAGAYA